MDHLDAAAAIRGHADTLTAALAAWADRDEPDADARRAANRAMDAIDAALADLHRLRAELVTDIRAADDATAARVDALLAERRAGGDPS